MQNEPNSDSAGAARTGYKQKPRPADMRDRGLKKTTAMRGLGAALQVVLLINIFVQTQLGAQGVQSGGGAVELDVHEVAGFNVTGIEGELAFAEVVDLLELESGAFHLTANGADEGVDGFFLAFGVEHDECLVFAIHGCCGVAG